MQSRCSGATKKAKKISSPSIVGHAMGLSSLSATQSSQFTYPIEAVRELPGLWQTRGKWRLPYRIWPVSSVFDLLDLPPRSRRGTGLPALALVSAAGVKRRPQLKQPPTAAGELEELYLGGCRCIIFGNIEREGEGKKGLC